MSAMNQCSLMNQNTDAFGSIMDYLKLENIRNSDIAITNYKRSIYLEYLEKYLASYLLRYNWMCSYEIYEWIVV
jgi:hypothetical protein